MKVMPVRLLDISNEDFPAIERWLGEDHVSRFWGEPAEKGHILCEPPPGTRCAVIEAGGRKVGLVLWRRPSRAELDEAGLTDVPATVADLDILIGEADLTGRGIGSAAIRLAAEAALAAETVPYVIAATATGNAASLRAFVKAGFRRDREFDDPLCGRCVLLVRRRLSDG